MTDEVLHLDRDLVLSLLLRRHDRAFSGERYDEAGVLLGDRDHGVVGLDGDDGAQLVGLLEVVGVPELGNGRRRLGPQLGEVEDRIERLSTDGQRMYGRVEGGGRP